MPTKAIQAKFATVRKLLCAHMIERDNVIDLILIALLARKHALLLGSPGTAKSLLIDIVAKDWLDVPLFDYIMTKFTEPSELFGPTDLVAMTQGTETRFRRVIHDMLPTAPLVFLDETFKGNSAILNCLLKVMNERRFRNGSDGWLGVPLRNLFGAANEFPNEQSGGEDLGAFVDRFTLRIVVENVRSVSGIRRLIRERRKRPTFTDKLTLAELDQAVEEVIQLPFAEETYRRHEKCIHTLLAAGIEPGGRRIDESVTAVQACAYLNGCDRVEPEHLEVLAHVLWVAPEQAQQTKKIVAEISFPERLKLNELRDAAEAVIKQSVTASAADRVTVIAKLEEVVKEVKALEGDATIRKKAKAFRLYVQEQLYEIQMLALHGKPPKEEDEED